MPGLDARRSLGRGWGCGWGWQAAAGLATRRGCQRWLLVPHLYRIWRVMTISIPANSQPSAAPRPAHLLCADVVVVVCCHRCLRRSDAGRKGALGGSAGTAAAPPHLQRRAGWHHLLTETNAYRQGGSPRQRHGGCKRQSGSAQRASTAPQLPPVCSCAAAAGCAPPPGCGAPAASSWRSATAAHRLRQARMGHKRGISAAAGAPGGSVPGKLASLRNACLRLPP